MIRNKPVAPELHCPKPHRVEFRINLYFYLYQYKSIFVCIKTKDKASRLYYLVKILVLICYNYNMDFLALENPVQSFQGS